MKSKTVSLGRYLKKINIRDRYSFSFVSFAANWKFIDDELKENVTDLEFESKYLNLAATTPDTSLYLDKAVCLKSNIFNIIPGIDKGKWNRLAYLLIKIKNKDINLCKRDKISYRWQLYLLLRKLFVIIAPDKFRQFLKKNVMNSKLFYTDN
jgi:hypothetical protein